MALSDCIPHRILCRISLARALYSDHEVILLDDPLSAVDVHVGEHIFEHTICRSFAGKTIIFVTHQLQYLSACDQVLFVHDGRVDVGKHDQLLASNDAYKVLQSHHNREVEEESTNDDDDDDNADQASNAENAVATNMSQYKDLRRNLSKAPQVKKQLKSELLGSKSAAGSVLIKVGFCFWNIGSTVCDGAGGLERGDPTRCCGVEHSGSICKSRWGRVPVCWYHLSVCHRDVCQDVLGLLSDVLDSRGESNHDQGSLYSDAIRFAGRRPISQWKRCRQPGPESARFDLCHGCAGLDCAPGMYDGRFGRLPT